MAIELRLLRYFSVVADELHIGNAAARLYISQPALSQQMRALEEQVGLPLLVRHPRGVSLTEAGEVLLAEAREVLKGSERLEATIGELRRGRTESLRLALIPGLPQTLLASLLGPLRERHPQVRLEVEELTTPDQVAALHEGALDLGLLREPVEDTRLARRTLLVEPLGLSAPAGHPLARRDAVSLRDLADETFICFPRHWAPALHDELAQAFAAAGMPLRYKDSEHLSTTEGMVAAGLALTFSARPWLEGAPGIAWVPLSDLHIEIRTAVAWRRDNRSPLLRELLDLLPAAAADEPRSADRSARP